MPVLRPAPRALQVRQGSGAGDPCPRSGRKSGDRGVSFPSTHSRLPSRGPRPRTLAEWLAGLERTGWKGKRAGREWSGPCPLCGGTDRFHVGPGSRVPVLAGCRHGCTFAQLAEVVHGRKRPGSRMAPPDWPNRPRTRPGKTRPKGESVSESIYGGFGGGGPSAPANPDDPDEYEAVGSPVTRKLDLSKGRGGTPGIRPGTEDHARRTNAARRLWERSGPVPADPEHPARRWSARRHPWPPDRAWPDAVRWLARFADGGGSVVATFAPLPDWLPPYGTAEMSESPGAVGVVTHQSTEGVGRVSGVQSLHVDADGRPRLDRPEDRGGLAKRSHGSMTGAVCLIGELAGSGPLHVVEGIADALAVAARRRRGRIRTAGPGPCRALAARPDPRGRRPRRNRGRAPVGGGPDAARNRGRGPHPPAGLRPGPTHEVTPIGRERTGRTGREAARSPETRRRTAESRRAAAPVRRRRETRFPSGAGTGGRRDGTVVRHGDTRSHARRPVACRAG